MSRRKNNRFILISLSIVFGWVMSFPYEGPVLYGLAGENGLDGVRLNMLTVFSHFMGLFSGSFIAADKEQAKKYGAICIIITLVVSLFVTVIDPVLWVFIIPILAFFSGVFISNSAHLTSHYTEIANRSKFMADILIYGNILLIAADVLVNHVSSLFSFWFIECLMLIAFVVLLKLEDRQEHSEEINHAQINYPVIATYWMFFVFIFIITINAGIMFQIIYPYYQEFGTLTSIYTNIPYIMAVYLLSRIIKGNKFYYLYIGLALWGATFILFPLLKQTPATFVIVSTLMLFAAGIFDYFWWSIMGNNFSYVKNPALLLGLGLSANVLGVWTGGVIANRFVLFGATKHQISYLGLFVVMICMLLVFPLNSVLSRKIAGGDFLVTVNYIDNRVGDRLRLEVEKRLSNREQDVFYLLIQNNTNVQIGQKLHLSLHTVKTHNRNIYKKTGVTNKKELIAQYKVLSK